jgi:hypothetical protein
VEDQGKSVSQDIAGDYQSSQARALAKATTEVEIKSRHLSEQSKGLSMACAAVESVIDYTEHCVEHSADDESKSNQQRDRRGRSGASGGGRPRTKSK